MTTASIDRRIILQPGTARRGYDGGKGGAGVAQWLICEMPPHRWYYEPFLGDGAVLRKKRAAGDATFGCELDEQTLAQWRGDEVRGLSVMHCDGLEFLRQRFGLCVAAGLRFPAPGSPNDHLVYCDPPYPMSVRSSDRPIYRFEWSDDDHRRFLESVISLRDLGVRVIVSSYANPLYNEALAGWRTSTFRTVDRGGNRKTESAWLSFERPAVLHDPRFVGGNKTRRVTVRRRAQTWAAGLLRMPPHERQRVFETLCQAMGYSAAEFGSGGSAAGCCSEGRTLYRSPGIRQLPDTTYP